MKKKSTKRSLLLSVLSLLVCMSMLVGSTFAWFTDSVTSANNIIKSGNLDVELYYQVEGQSDWTKVTTDTNVFMENALWEPGHTEVVKLKIVNEGSLVLKYNLGVNIVSETGSKTEDGKDFMLSDFIKYGIVAGEQRFTREQAIDAVEGNATTLKSVYNSQALPLHPKVDDTTAEDVYTDIVTMVVYMPTTVGNEANHAKDAAQPVIKLGINLLATQQNFEADSFGPDYDNMATYDDNTYRVADSSESAAGTPGEIKTVANENNSFVATAKVGAQGTLTAKIAAANSSEAAFSFADANGLHLASYDIEVTGQQDSTEVTVSIFLGKARTGVYVYRDGVKMDAADYSYDPTSGVVTIKTADFSVFDITYGESGNIVNNYDEIWYEYYDSSNIVIGADFDAADMMYFDANTEHVIDLNGKTITAGNRGQYLFAARGNSVVTLTGDGVVDAGKGFFAPETNGVAVINGGTYTFDRTTTLNNIKHHSLAQNGGKIVINGGTFISNVEDAVLFFATSNARIEINGGFFENKADQTPDLLGMGANKYNTNRIVLTGGTFVNYNPMEDRMCYTGAWPENGEAAFGGPWMLIPGGYTVVAETQSNGDVWYTVVPVPAQ